MLTLTINKTHRCLMFMWVWLFVIPMNMEAAEGLTQQMLTPERLTLTSGKSMVLRSQMAVKRISVADPDVADFLLLSPNEIYLTGKKAGTTNLTLWKNGRISAIYDLEVVYDLSMLKHQVYQLLPDEKELQILNTGESITLSGRISSAANLSKLNALARAYAPEGRVNNLVEVGGVHQVMLEVRVAEIGRSTTKRLGINFNYVNGAEFGVSLLGGLSQLAGSDGGNLGGYPGFGLNVSPAVNALFRFNDGDATWTGLIDALKEDGLVKILAEPTLISLSGQKADFLAGGEFPVPVPQGLGTVAIDYKSFGVGLSFTPTVISPQKISIQVTPDVSELDFSTAVQFSGFVVPGVTTRRATTTVELADGQSFAIAGLLRETIRDAVQKFPLLGDIPILGALFRSHSFQKSETELIIIVTPRLVKPLDTAKQSVPTDFYIEPNDTEFFIEGLMEGREKSPAAGDAQLEGDFGHSLKDAG